jgi:hypothetical protein
MPLWRSFCGATGQQRGQCWMAGVQLLGLMIRVRGFLRRKPWRCNASGRRSPFWGRRVFLPSSVIHGWKPGPLWTCDDGAISVAPFLKASHLDHRRGFDFGPVGRRLAGGLPSEVGAVGSFCFHARQRWPSRVSCLCTTTSHGLVSYSGALWASRLVNLACT